LCGKCNTALGMFDDNVNRVHAAAKYLELFKNGVQPYKLRIANQSTDLDENA
jgi:hypothetical protein